MLENDILDLESLHSIPRTRFEKNVINLREEALGVVGIPEGCEIKDCRITDGRPSEIREFIEPIALRMENSGFPSQLYTVLYEAVLNAYQHGNQGDSSKRIRLGYKIIPTQVDIFVEDEGGMLNSNFIPFVLRHRELSHLGRITNFYEFSGLEKPRSHEGKGTSFMHLYASEVHYYKAQSGGLLVHIIKRK